MKCSFCGADMLPSDKFCNNCGASNPNAANNGAPSRIPDPSGGNGQYGQNYNGYGQNNGQYGQNYNGYGQNNGQYGQNYGGYGQNNGQYGQNYNGYGQNNGQYGQNYGGYGQNNGQYYGRGYVDPELSSRVAAGELVSPAYVGFGDAVKLFFKNFTNFKGRSTRSEYWYVVVFNMLINFVLSFITTGVVVSSGDTTASSVISGLYSLIVLVPTLALITRRLHDIGKSGWWYLIIFTCVGAFVLLYWFCQPSVTTNQYGPSANELYGGTGYGNGGPGSY